MVKVVWNVRSFRKRNIRRLVKEVTPQANSNFVILVETKQGNNCCKQLMKSHWRKKENGVGMFGFLGATEGIILMVGC